MLVLVVSAGSLPWTEAGSDVIGSSVLLAERRATSPDDAAGTTGAAEQLLMEAAVLLDEGLAMPAGLPINSSIRSKWGMRMHPIKKRMLPHHGVDLRCSVGTEVRVTADGIVIDSGRDRGAGLWVRVRHGGGYGTFYAHLDSSLVQTGAAVRSGEVIALSGQSGAVTAPHLHYELNWGGKRSDSLSLPVDALQQTRDSLLNRAERLIERSASL